MLYLLSCNVAWIETVMNGNIQMFLNCLILRVETVCFSGMLVAVFQSVWFQISLYLNLEYTTLLSISVSSISQICQTYYKYFNALACLKIVTLKDWMIQINRYICVFLHAKFYLPRSSGPLFLLHYICKFCSNVVTFHKHVKW